MTTTHSIPCQTCSNDLWDVDRYGDNPKAVCTNCGHVRPFTPRQPGNEVTPSQEAAVTTIRRYFDGSWIYGKATRNVAEDRREIVPDAGGLLAYTIRVGDHVFNEDGGFFLIGRRGRIKVCSTYSLTGDRRGHMRHVAEMVGGHVDP